MKTVKKTEVEFEPDDLPMVFKAFLEGGGHIEKGSKVAAVKVICGNSTVVMNKVVVEVVQEESPLVQKAKGKDKDAKPR